MKSDVTQWDIRKADDLHLCSSCDEKIYKGEFMEHVDDDGNVYCLPCAQMWHALDDLYPGKISRDGDMRFTFFRYIWNHGNDLPDTYQVWEGPYEQH